MNPNYVSSGIPQYLSPTAYPQYPAQQYGYRPLQPKSQTNAVNIEIIGPTANGAGAAGAMPIYPGMTQVMQPQVPSAIPMPPAPMPMPMYMPPAGPNQTVQPYIPPPSPAAGMTPPPIVPSMPMPPVPATISQVQPQINQPQLPSPQVAPQASPLVSAIGVISGGSQANLDQQSTALKTINEHINLVNTMDAAAQKTVNEQLLPNDGSTFKGLAALAAADTSAYSGPEKQKADEVRVMSMLTLANLQKYFRQEFDNQLKKENIQGVPSVSLGELPGIKTIVQVTQADSNPEVREAGIYAMMGAADPNNQQDIQILKTVLQNSAANDQDARVKGKAQEALAAIEGDPKAA